MVFVVGGSWDIIILSVWDVWGEEVNSGKLACLLQLSQKLAGPKNPLYETTNNSAVKFLNFAILEFIHYFCRVTELKIEGELWLLLVIVEVVIQTLGHTVRAGEIFTFFYVFCHIYTMKAYAKKSVFLSVKLYFFQSENLRSTLRSCFNVSSPSS